MEPTVAENLIITHNDASAILSAVGSALYNPQTGMGTGFSAANNIQIGCAALLHEQHLRMLYRSNWWIGRIIDMPAIDMTKKGLEIKLLKGGDSDGVAAVKAKYGDTNPTDSPFESEYSIDQAKEDAIRWARLFGRAYIVCHLNQGEDPKKPLTKVRSFDGVTVLDRYQLRPALGERNLFNPEFYEIVLSRDLDTARSKNLDMPWGTVIHRSRVLPYNGNRIHPYDLQIEGDGGHDSVVQRLFEIFLRYYQGKEAVSEALNSFSLFVATINGLAGILGGPGGVGVLKEYIQTLNIQRSVYRTVVRDGEAGGTDFVERSFQGVAENIQAMADEMTAASGLPHYKIWGNEHNSNALSTGGSETRSYAELVNGWQISDLKPNDRRLLKMLFQSETGSIPESFDIEYPSIYQPTPQELAEIREKEANTYAKLIDSQVVKPMEVKLAISTGQAIENVLDEQLVREELEVERRQAEQTSELKNREIEKLLNPPEAPDVAPEGETVEGTPSLEEVSTMLDSLDVRLDKGKGGSSGKKKGGKGGGKARKNCEKGITCGGSCISRSKVCRKDGNETQKVLAKKIKANAGSESSNEKDSNFVKPVTAEQAKEILVSNGARPFAANSLANEIGKLGTSETDMILRKAYLTEGNQSGTAVAGWIERLGDARIASNSLNPASVMDFSRENSALTSNSNTGRAMLHLTQNAYIRANAIQKQEIIAQLPVPNKSSSDAYNSFYNQIMNK